MAIIAIGLSLPACNDNAENTVTRRDINSVKEEHAPELMTIRGVVGVYVGQTEDGGACIFVMVEALTPDIKGQIPAVLDGYAVKIEETGEIRPMISRLARHGF